MIVATTRAALLRGSTTDGLGDEVDTNATPVVDIDWTEARRNAMLNPSMDTTGSIGWASAVSLMTASFTGEAGAEEQGARRATILTLSAGNSVGALYGSRNNALMPLGAAGDVYTLGIRCRASRPMDAVMALGYGGSSSTTGVVIPCAVGTVEADFFGVVGVGAAAAGQRLNLRLSFMASAAINPLLVPGDWIEWSKPLLTPGEWGAPYSFRGSDQGGPLERYSYAGTPERSASILETGVVRGDWSDFPISIIEKDATEFDQASATWRSVQKLVGRAAADVPVDEGDRIKDLRDGRIYAVDNVRRTPRSISGRSSVTMRLRRTNP